MLSVLHLENIAIIKRADVDFDSGFSVMTGETGAGKSIIIDSVNLLLGGRFSRDIIRSGEDTALVSAVFSNINDELAAQLSPLGIEAEEDGCIYIQRTLHADGRTQARINGSPVPIATLREAAACLITIHGQHDNQQLLSADKHIYFLDEFMDNDAVYSAYHAEYTRLSSIRERLIKASRDAKESERTVDILKFQIAEIDEAKLKRDEDKKLEGERMRIRDLDKLSSSVSTVYHSLYRNDAGTAAVTMVQSAIESIERLKDYIPETDEYIEKLSSFRYDMEDIALSVNSLCEDIPEDPAQSLDRIESRLDTIEKLKRKYGSDIDEILRFRDDAAQKLGELECIDDTVKKLKKEYIAAEKATAERASALHDARCSSAEVLERRIEEELSFLGMANASFKVNFEQEHTSSGSVKYTKNGSDRVEFLFSANKGEPPKPLGRIASGGELSRVMLAIKSIIAQRDMMPTLIFDEVDVGVSGRISQRIGIKLREISKYSQVICVTHSAQIASVANHHFKIEKSESEGRVTTSVRPLDEDGRITELASIMGGDHITDTLLDTAREMLSEFNR